MNKPTVNYTVQFGPLVLGKSAFVRPTNHPNHLPEHNVSNQRIVRTSEVVKIMSDGFETLNTIYKEQSPISSTG